MITKFKLFEDNKNKSIIDYTFLKNRSSVDEIKKACEDADDAGVYSIVVKSENIGTAKAFLDESDVKIVSVIDFPKGNSKTNYKSNLTMEAITDGANEIDLVFNYSKLKELSILDESDYEELYTELSDDIQTNATLCHKNGVLLKVIIEIEELNFEQIKIACEICEKSSVDYIQTSTGYSKKNPNWKEKIEKVKYIKRIIPSYINIKVAGGIRTQSQIDELISLGVDRIGTSVLL